MRRKKTLLFAISLFFFFQLFTSGGVSAREMEYPEKEIQFLVGYTAGTTMDLSARALSKVALKYLAKPLVVVNVPGAASTVAYNELVNAPPNGHTIAVITNAYRGTTIHQQNIPFNPKILKAVLGYAEYVKILFVRGDSPYGKFEDLIAYGRKNPGAIKWGHSGRGIAGHLQTTLLFRRANVQAIDVPYKGTPEFIQAVLGGHIMAAVVDISGVKNHVRAGTLKLVLAFGDERLKEFPEIPTSTEKGYTGLGVLNTIIYVCIHKDTPFDRVKKIHDALRKAVEDPEFIRIMEDMGQRVGYFAPEVVEESVIKTETLGVPLLKELKLFLQ